MKTFILDVVEDVLKKHSNSSNLVFVLPSQRACVFLKEEILKILPENSFLPKIVSIENYIQELADISLIDNVQLLFEFYSIYKKNNLHKSIDEFDSFSQWATIALHDFNEIDSYLVETEDFFSNLRDIKQLNNWFQENKPSQLAINYLQFFDDIYVLYNQLYQQLKSNKFGYQGLIYREAKENLEFYIENNTTEHIVFVGFNALNKAEEYIFQELLNNNMASIYWDSSLEMMKRTNEAGVFLRKYKNEWAYYKTNPFLHIEDFSNLEQNTHIIAAPKNNTQIKFVGELLEKIPSFNKTALVLADENVLSLMLNSLPSNVKNMNITMGYALKDIPLAHFFEKLFKLYLNKQKFEKETNTQFYYKDVLNVLNDPFLNKFETDVLQKVVQKIKSDNHIFLSEKTITEPLHQNEKETISLILGLFQIQEKVDEMIETCIQFIDKLKDKVQTAIEKEYLFRFYTIFNQLKSLNVKYHHIQNLKTLYLFFYQLLKNEKLSFKGEPLEGLQLMGMLETRVLDFETVIITSVNEGVLPAGKSENSFIPFDVKKHFGLPTYLEKDAIFSYHFQRLIQRAKNVYLIYNTETDGYGAGEKSRFITRLEIENKITEKTIVSPKVQPFKLAKKTIEKTPEVIEKLQQLFQKGISASALATYIYNPITFYENYVLGINEEKEVEETIEANTMGNVIHEVLKELYLPFKDAFLTKQAYLEMHKKVEDLLQKYFAQYYKNGTILTGKNKLIFEVSKTFIQKFIASEEKQINAGNKLKIKALEEKIVSEIKIPQVQFPIKLKGFVDRIDEFNGTVRIIDYKTGKVDAGKLKINDFSLLPTDYNYTKAIQVMFYSLLYSKEIQFNENEFMEAGIISFKNLNSGLLRVNFSEKRGGTDYLVTKDKIHEFELVLGNLIAEILDSNKPFIENTTVPF